MNQAVDRLPINMGDQVTLSEPCLVGRSPFLHMPDHVMYSVDVRVTHVHSDGSQSKAILLSSSVDDDGRFDISHSWRQVPAW